MNRRARGWLAGFGEVLRAVKSDPVLLVPTVLVVALALAAGYLLWRFI